MSALHPHHGDGSEVHIGSRVGRVAVAAPLIAALAVELAGGGRLTGVLLAGLGALMAGGWLAPRVWRALGRQRALWLVLPVLGAVVLWLIAGLGQVNRTYSPGVFTGQLLDAFNSGARSFFLIRGWPWRIGNTPLLIPVVTLIAAGGGLVLIADAVRVQLGLAPPRRSPWRVMTSRRADPVRVFSRALPGVGLVILAAVLGVSYAQSYVGYEQPGLRLLVVVLIGLWAVTLIAAPPLIGVWLVLDRDKAGRAREEERLRFAAHLHDSVLQTLALIQRQAQDPATVSRLARRQEHALRAWMAGQSDLASATIASALREVVDEVEDERGITVEQTIIGDRQLSAGAEALVAAAREALRNAAAHAPGSAVTVYAQIGPEGTEVFVRDAGPGFAMAEVPEERRGIRDAIIGRMSSVGGSAVVESTPGEGTEVILRLA